MQGRKLYNEKLFAQFQLSERVPADNFYRKLKDSLDLRFLYKITQRCYGNEGQKSIDPIVFFKLILIGYLENLNSDRRIISHASMRLDLLYFIGYDIDEELPWHSTLSRTRQLYGEEVFRELFKSVLGLCVDKGMVSGKRQAIDSAYIKANASMNSLQKKEVMDDADAFADELEKNNDFSDKNEIEAKPDNKKEQAQVKKTGNKTSNKTHFSPTDSDARISVKPGKRCELTYSGHASVDTQQHVITNIMADYSDKRDSQALPAVLDQTITNLSEHNLQLKEVLADTNYSSGESLRYMEENAITGYIPNIGAYKPERDNFIYNPEEDLYQCTQGINLPLKRIRGRKKEYETSPKDCQDCPLRLTCLNRKSFKQITHNIDRAYYDRMHQRLQTIKAKRMRKVRSATVEPVLGSLINYYGLKSVRTRGIQQANKYMLGAAIAYNLKKWMNYTVKPIKSAVMSKTRLDLLIEKGQNRLAKHILLLFELSHPVLRLYIRI
jgi:transposase